MSEKFITDDFLLQTGTARTLYHEYAEAMPIYDFHCHLPPDQIAGDKRFETITQAWLAGDHYKWRAMRANGVDERYCTGDASDREKFGKWAQTVPFTLRNPLYHWTHLELKRYFDIDLLLSPETADEIYDRCSEMLGADEFHVRGLLGRMNVELVCTTDDPLDSLEYHEQISAEGLDVKVYPAWRPDKALAADNLEVLNGWIDKMGELSGRSIGTFDEYLDGLSGRVEFFHSRGCRLSDHGLETLWAGDYSAADLKDIFQKIRGRQVLSADEQLKFRSAVLHEMATMYHEKGWVQQFHLGALRNNNTLMMNRIGPDTGFDSMGDFSQASNLAAFFGKLAQKEKLTKTVLYNLNPCDNEVFATMLGNFQDSSCPGKMQFGSAWWYLDQIDGMEKQINVLSNMGLLSRFIGMLTDSRSFLSFPRHEYFRRILCNLLGSDVEKGLLPGDIPSIGKMVQDISIHNARNYFDMSLD